LDLLNNQSGITFVSLHVDGTLSAVDLASLIERTKGGAIRLLLFFYQQLLFSLHLTNTAHSVITPKSLQSVNHIKTVAYDDSTVAGSITIAHSKLYKQKPSQFYDLKELESIRKKMKRRMRWNIKEAKWRESQITFSEDLKDTFEQIYTTLVCEDPDFIEMHYQQLRQETVKILNARNPRDIANFMEKGAAPSQALFSVSKTQTARMASKSAATSSEFWQVCIVVINSQLMSSSQR
jgi:hypothetical protein